jgi:hypothetical protein
MILDKNADVHFSKSPLSAVSDHKELVMSTSTPKQPAIVRIWRGRTLRDCADEYEAYNYEAGIKPLIKKALGVQTLREDRENETEFMTISYWESVEAMSKFTAEELRLDAYMSYLRPVLAQVNGRVVDTVKRIEDRRFAGRRGDAHDRRCTLRGASSPARALQRARDPSCCAGCVRPALTGGYQGRTRS